MNRKLFNLLLGMALLVECAVFRAQAAVSISSVQPITLNTLKVTFSAPVDPTTLGVAGNFAVNNGITVGSAAPSGNNAAIIHTSISMTPAQPYTLTASNIKDEVGTVLPALSGSFSAPIVQAGRIAHKAWNARNGTNPLDVLSDARYPDSPSQSTFEPTFEYPPGGGSGRNGWDNEIVGWYIPPITGDYVFFIASDDNGSLFLSTDDNPANKKLIAQETGWSSSRAYNTSSGGSVIDSKRSDLFTGTEWPGGHAISLVAGKPYYVQGLYHEGPPINNFALYIQEPGSPPPPDGTLPTSASQFVNYISLDTFAPFNFTEAVGSSGFNQVTLKFSYELDAVSLDAANFTIPGLTVNGARFGADSKQVVLDTSPQTPGTTYTVTADGVKDILGRPLPANGTTAKFTAFVLAQGGVIHKFWTGITPQAVESLFNDPRYPNDPTWTSIEPLFEYLPNGASDAGSQYGNQLSGWIIPPVDGVYVFFLCSDDSGSLYLSTDENPDNKKLIAQETIWSNPRQWLASGGNSNLEFKRSDQFVLTEWPEGNTITLKGGKRYWIEADHTEGAGGDNLGVTWQKPGDLVPENGSAPIAATFIENYLNPPAVVITEQPATQNINPGQTATFSVVATGNGPLTYQWQKAAAGSSAFANIAGATGATLTTPALALSDQGTQYRVVITSEGFPAVTSSVALVSLDSTPPSIARIQPVTLGIARVIFSEPVLASSVNNAANYSLDGGLTVQSVEVLNNTTVLLKTSQQTEATSYTLTVKNAKDIWNNNAASISLPFTSLVARPNLVFHRFFSDVLDVNPLNLPQDPRYPDNPTFATFEPGFEYPRGGGAAGDNYGNELYAWFVPKATGNYVFHLAADNAASLFLSTDEDPSNKKRVAQETVWSSTRQWTTSGGNSSLEARRSDTFAATEWPGGNTITLTEGKRYYMQVLHHEEVGGDYVGVFIQAPGGDEPVNNDPPASGSNFVLFIDPGAYSPFSFTEAMGSSFGLATLTFAYDLDAASIIPGNFSIPGLTVTGAKLSADLKHVVLITSAQAPGTVYNVTASNVKDILGRSLSGKDTASFPGWSERKGGVIQKYWSNIIPNGVDTLLADPRFPASPDSYSVEPRFEYARNAVNEAGDNYGNQLYGWLVPPVDGSYVFFLASDNAGRLFLSTDENPANKKLIAEETIWSNAREYNTSGGNSDLVSKRSDQFESTEWPGGKTISLTGGKRYYIEALHTEEIGGDNVSVAWQKPGDAAPANGALPIDGGFIVNLLPPTRTILFVGADPGPLTFAGDRAVYQHLQDRGFVVDITTGAAVPADGSTAIGKDLVIVSSSLASGTVAAKFRDVKVPVLLWEAAVEDDFSFQAAGGTTTGADQTQINIVDPASPLAAGFPAGLRTVTSSGQVFSAGVPTGARVAATLATDSNAAVLYSYRTGDKAFNNFVIPARRAFIFLQDNTATALNPDGWRIFDATTDWLVLPDAAAPTVSVTRSGADIVLNFTGILQEADSITGPWGDVTGATSPRTVTPAAGATKFWRSKQ